MKGKKRDHYSPGGSYKLEQIEFKLEKIIGIQKHVEKVRKFGKYLNNVSDETKAPVRQMFGCEYVMTLFIN